MLRHIITLIKNKNAMQGYLNKPDWKISLGKCFQIHIYKFKGE